MGPVLMGLLSGPFLPSPTTLLPELDPDSGVGLVHAETLK